MGGLAEISNHFGSPLMWNNNVNNNSVFEGFVSANNERKDDTIVYSDKYMDKDMKYEYRHVRIPDAVLKMIDDTSEPLYEHQWRSLGIQQSAGWQHLMFFKYAFLIYHF
jgi:hypothetical protein